jgi:putative ABC transport system ATP-binding protein
MPPPRVARSEQGGEAPAAPLVRLDEVSKAYRAGGTATSVLRSTTLALARGETTSLVGVSGSGKSTLISLLAGLMRPDSGRILFESRDIAELDDVPRASLRARRIGVVLQSGNLIPFLTAGENVELAMTLAGRAPSAGRSRELLSEVGVGRRIDHLPRRLSGGEAQRVAVAMALANEPELLLADEVTGELDSASAEAVMATIFSAARERGLTVLYVTHNDALAARADRRLRLQDGEVRAA